ncbi:hypothetical protein B0T18DRAFT_397114 [Schizothecium vesticola]|uniref:Uncharacterized protein n=1 Tax=Schizothecium vesticola TaxID=314040 RepID=A0AA40KC59_9PEZI|nr:hypothetical protein B0T18DRAFT_397114 [Schizothecium vesticola]
MVMAHGGRWRALGRGGKAQRTVLGWFYRDRRQGGMQGAEDPAEYLLDVIRTARSAGHGQKWVLRVSGEGGGAVDGPVRRRLVATWRSSPDWPAHLEGGNAIGRLLNRTRYMIVRQGPTDQVLATVRISHADRWRDGEIGIVYVVLIEWILFQKEMCSTLHLVL